LEIEDRRSAQTSQSPSSQLPTQKAEDTGQRTDGGSGVAENRGQKTENTVQKSEASAPNLSTSQPLNSSTLDELEQLAAKLVEKNPRSLPHRTFLALARLKQNRAAEALAVYENVTVARGALTPSALAVHAAVLAANGRKDEAKSEISQIRTDQLLPEEKELIQDLL
jgi:hypothetical protein